MPCSLFRTAEDNVIGCCAAWDIKQTNGSSLELLEMYCSSLLSQGLDGPWDCTDSKRTESRRKKKEKPVLQAVFHGIREVTSNWAVELESCLSCPSCYNVIMLQCKKETA